MPIPTRALLYRKTKEPAEITISFNGELLSIRLRRHARARRYTLGIHATTGAILLTIPPRGSIREATEFAIQHAGWIAARIQRLPSSILFMHGAIVPIRGINTRIEHRRDMPGSAWLECGEDGASLLCIAGEAPHVARRVRDYLKREAKRDFEAATQRVAHILGVRVVRISIRDQVSRWGSCSTSGVLSYSWRLIMAPPFVLDYLATHEVAHLIEMNHSLRFWRLVERICPHTNSAKAWLTEHGSSLHRYRTQ
jgi:predicted metal-dependent hydrolase